MIISKIADHARGPGAGRFESAAYTAVCEHFERPATPPTGVRCIFEIASTDVDAARGWESNPLRLKNLAAPKLFFLMY
jgi:hypothetical protein